jgi:formate hydrogenlyase subunit 3/multisubunit Na+/H+ antiporter MnhD subunit
MGACVVAGIVVRALCRWPRACWLAAFVSVVLIGALLIFAPAASLSFFGRALALDVATRAFLLALFFATSALALLAPLASARPHASPTNALTDAHGAFFLLAFAPFIAAVTLDSFPLAVFAWAMGLGVLMLSARPQSEGRVGGTAQFLLLMVLASASLLLANRFLEVYPLTPENLDLVRAAAIFLALGFGVLLALAPLHFWLGPLADEWSPLGVAFLVGVAQAVGVWVLWQQMNAALWLTLRSPLLSALLVGGGLTALVGALLALAERRDARALAYLAMVPLGLVGVGMGTGAPLPLAGALVALVSRAWSVALIAGGMHFARHHPARHGQLVSAGALLVGGLALVGLGPFAGFVAYDAIARAVSASHPALFVVLVAAHALALVTIVRRAWRIISAPVESDSRAERVALVAGVGVVIFVSAMLIGAGIFPQMFEAMVKR